MTTSGLKLLYLMSVGVWLCCQTAGGSGADGLALKCIGNPDQFVEISDSPVFHFTTNLTVEAWLFVPDGNPDFPRGAGGPDRWIAVGKRADGSEASFGLGMFSSAFGLHVEREGQGGLAAVSPRSKIFNVWKHVAGTFDGKAVQLFVDGEPFDPIRSDVSAPIKKSSQPLLIGKQGLPGSENTWVGLIDEVRLWNRVLSAEEISGRMWVRLTGSEPGLVGYWNFDSKDARDFSRDKNHGVIHGNAPLVESPYFPIARPVLEQARFVFGQGLEFEFRTAATMDYTVQRSSDLLRWENVNTFSGDDGPVSFVDAASPGFGAAFYRVLVNFPVRR